MTQQTRISPDIRRRIEAFQSAGMLSHADELIFNIRCNRARLKFATCPLSSFVEILTGKPHTHLFESTERQPYEWAYNHLDGKEYVSPNCTYYTDQIVFARIEKRFWDNLKEVWRVQVDRLDAFEPKVPYGIVLKINEIKKLKLFNAFCILAPTAQYKSLNTAMALGEIWHLTREVDFYSVNRAYFLIAKWAINRG